MIKKQPERFNFSMLQEAVENTQMRHEGLIFNKDFAVVNDADDLLFRYMLSKRVPLLIDDYRLGMVLDGEIHGSFNLIEQHVTPGTLVFIGPGTIIQPISIAGRLRIKGIALFGDLPVSDSRQPAILNGSIRNFLIPAEGPTLARVEQMIDLLWATAQADTFCRETFDSLVAAMLYQYNHLYYIKKQQNIRPSHATDIFNRFIRLVNQYSRQERSLAFYAGQLCLTQRYLGTIIRQASGTTAKEWIDRAVTTEAKILLKHSNRPIADIADALHFPNPSFFSKYFRRLTGMTPAEYRGM